jgi:hypothetical protein
MPYYRFRQAALLYLFAFLSPSMSTADVDASIDRSAVSLGEALQLTIESIDEPGARPDLSVLTTDFEILDRHSSHNVSVINGRRSERHVLILRLRPRRVGELRIPAISFGDRATEPLQLKVASAPMGSSERADEHPPFVGTGEAVPAPNVMPETDLEPSQGYTRQQYRLPAFDLEWWNTSADRWETARLPPRDIEVSPAPADVPRQPLPGITGPRQNWQQTAQQEQTEPAVGTLAAPPRTGEGDAATPNGHWMWIPVVFALVWIATMAGWWRSKRRAVAVATATVVAEPPPPTEEANPLKGKIDAVRTAYQAGDPRVAREALLTWAGQVFAEQTPSNLARLAQRCPQPLRGQILLLEQSFFSPRPIAWDRQPVWKGLAGFVPAPPEEPASFRRRKPIRRRSANPDAE